MTDKIREKVLEDETIKGTIIASKESFGINMTRVFDLTEKLARKECDNNCKAKCIYLSEEVAKAENKLSGIREEVEALKTEAEDNEERYEEQNAIKDKCYWEGVVRGLDDILKIINKESGKK